MKRGCETVQEKKNPRRDRPIQWGATGRKGRKRKPYNQRKSGVALKTQGKGGLYTWVGG